MLTFYGKAALNLCMARFMLCSGNAEFIDKTSVDNEYKNSKLIALKLNDQQNLKEIIHQLRIHDELEEIHLEETNDSLINEMGTLTALGLSDPVACIINFPNQENSLLIAGFYRNYYFMDNTNEIFWTTESPEYIISSYANKYGHNEQYTIAFYKIRAEKQEEQEPEPEQKKVKKIIKKKKTTIEV